jgi:hypothetical protein
VTTHGGSRGIECYEHNLDYFEQQVERIDTQVTALYASQQRRQSHLVVHGANQRDLGASDSVFGERIRQNTVRSVQDPPTYITKTLGPRPTEPAKGRAWVSAVVAIAQNRVVHDLTDRRTAIGPEPHHCGTELAPSQRVHPRRPRRHAPPQLSVQPSVSRIDGPSLGLGL